MEKPFELTYNKMLLRHIKKNLDDHNPNIVKDKVLRRAAVALTVVDVDESSRDGFISSYEVENGDAALILTRRSFRLKNHAGQWALPGGRIDTDETPEETALRELSEEVGLRLTEDYILGRLDDFATRSGFVMSPIVLWGGNCGELRPNPGEVASIHRIPLKEFLRKDAPVLEDIPESKSPVLYMPVGSSWIAAPTAALLYQFREVALLGKKTSVSHYEQPYFAWS